MLFAIEPRMPVPNYFSNTFVASLEHALDMAVLKIVGCSSSADQGSCYISCVMGYTAFRYMHFKKLYFTFPLFSMVLTCVIC